MAGPYYIVFAGVNGAGKSTLFKTGQWQHGPITADFPRVNPDEILVESGWDWRDGAAQLRAGKEAVRRIRRHLANRESFNQETTLTGHTIMRNIREARKAGFYIVMFYVGLDDPAIANARIEHRGRIGGHVIDPRIVEKRYQASLANLIDVLDDCAEAYLYDNTSLLRLAARLEYGELAYVDQERWARGWTRGVLESLGYMEISLRTGEPNQPNKLDRRGDSPSVQF